MNETMMVSNIETRSPFKDFFSINPVVLGAIEKDMKQYGYDESAPIVLWKEGNVVVDGHTRLQAAKNAGLKEVNVCMGEFTEQTAIEYAIHNQRDRRNLTDAEILRLVEAVDKKVGRWPSKHLGNITFEFKGDIEPADIIDDDKISSHKKTATEVGISAYKVNVARTILDAKNGQIKQEVLAGKKSIHAASEEIKKAKLKDRPMEARMNMASSKLEKDLKKSIATAVKEGLPMPRIKQVVKDLLKDTVVLEGK